MKKLAILGILALSLGACTAREHNTGVGALLGAGAGAIIGGAATGKVGGALAGAAIGGAGGAIIGSTVTQREYCHGYDYWGRPIRYEC